ncbi:hypothetical protein JW721_02870 [Candidatus Micrarchaeota archaeon]|nr:hypothetical protein [Candidatus Micrarchaeota archaeon]
MAAPKQIRLKMPNISFPERPPLPSRNKAPWPNGNLQQLPLLPKKWYATSPPSSGGKHAPAGFSGRASLKEGSVSTSSKQSAMGRKVLSRARKNEKTGEWEEIDANGNVLPKKAEPPNPSSTSIWPDDPRWKKASGKGSTASSKKKRVRLPALVPPSKKPRVAPYDPLKKPPKQAPASTSGNSNPILNLPNLPRKKGKVVIGGNKPSVPTPPNKRAVPGPILPGPHTKDAYKDKDAGTPAKRDTIPATPRSKAKAPGNPKAKDGENDEKLDPYKFLEDDEDYAWEQGLPALRTSPLETDSGEPTLTISAKDFGLKSKGERTRDHTGVGEGFQKEKGSKAKNGNEQGASAEKEKKDRIRLLELMCRCLPGSFHDTDPKE